MHAVEHPRPQRLMHGLNLLSVLVLGGTGYLIAFPRPGIPIFPLAYAHELLGFIFALNLLVRVYYAFFGRYADRTNFSLRDGSLRKLWPQIRYYLFLGPEPESRGYNPLQRAAYLFIALLILFQSLTGLTLAFPEKWRPVAAALGGLAAVRGLHLFVFFVFLTIIVVHPYLVLIEAPEELGVMFLGRPLGGAGGGAGRAVGRPGGGRSV